MKCARLFLTVFLFSLIGLYGYPQTRIIDKLKLDIQNASTDINKLKTLLALCELEYNLHPDTLMYYAENASLLALKLGNTQSDILARFYQSGALTTKGLVDSSLSVADKCLADLLKTGQYDEKLKGNLYNQKGRCYMRRNKYKEAIDMGYKAIIAGEKAGDLLLQIKAKTLLGWAYLEMGQDSKSLDWHLKALRTTTDSITLQKYGILFANLALNYSGIGKTDSAFYYIDRAVLYSRKHENLFALSNSLAIRAQLLVRAGRAPEAEASLSEVVKIRKLIGDPFYIVSDMSQLGIYYAHNGQPQKGIRICREGINIALKYGIETKLFFLYNSLAENYKTLGDKTGYAETLEKIIILKDSVYQKNSAHALAEIQTRYESEKNANTINRQKLAIIEKNYWIYGSLGLLLIASFIFFLIFSNYRKKQNLRNEILLKEEKYLSAQAILKAEENERKRIAADLHDNIGAYASAMRADIETITSNNLVKNNTSLQNLQQHSQEIIDSLRDTIWVLNKENITITGISDRIKNYINKLQPSYTNIQILISDEIKNDVRISSKNALNIFRIVQEAIHNALKHSDADTIFIKLESERTIRIEISDNGNGLDETKPLDGLGLNNMRARAKEIDMQLSISTIKDEGTILVLEKSTTN